MALKKTARQGRQRRTAYESESEARHTGAALWAASYAGDHPADVVADLFPLAGRICFAVGVAQTVHLTHTGQGPVCQRLGVLQRNRPAVLRARDKNFCAMVIPPCQPERKASLSSGRYG